MSYLSDVLKLGTASPSTRVGVLNGAGTLTFNATTPVNVRLAGNNGATGTITLDGVSVTAQATGTIIPPSIYATIGAGQSTTVVVTGAAGAAQVIFSVSKTD